MDIHEIKIINYPQNKKLEEEYNKELNKILETKMNRSELHKKINELNRKMKEKYSDEVKKLRNQ